MSQEGQSTRYLWHMWRLCRQLSLCAGEDVNEVIWSCEESQGSRESDYSTTAAKVVQTPNSVWRVFNPHVPPTWKEHGHVTCRTTSKLFSLFMLNCGVRCATGALGREPSALHTAHCTLHTAPSPGFPRLSECSQVCWGFRAQDEQVLALSCKERHVKNSNSKS